MTTTIVPLFFVNQFKMQNSNAGEKSDRRLFNSLRMFLHKKLNKNKDYYNNNNRNEQNLMFPRVYAHAHSIDDNSFDSWDPVDLTVNEKLVVELDNVIDKFTRVINVNNYDTPAAITSSFYVRVFGIVDLIHY